MPEATRRHGVDVFQSWLIGAPQGAEPLHITPVGWNAKRFHQQFPLTRRVVDRGEFGAAARTGRRSSPSPTRDDVETVS